MLNCIIVDDEKHAIKVLETHILQTPLLKLQQSFKNSVEAMSWLTTNKSDLIFLDINMPKMTGLDIAKAVKDKALVIFCTAYREYGAESYEHGVVDYLLKPVKYARFFQAVEKAIRLSGMKGLHHPESDMLFIMVNVHNKLIRIAHHEILYISADRSYSQFHLVKNKITSFILLKNVLDRLPQKQFVRVHHSYIVSMNHIKQVDNSSILLNDCTAIIPIGDAYRTEFLNKLKAND
jgi:two-component system, LytTR family, response regulator